MTAVAIILAVAAILVGAYVIWVVDHMLGELDRMELTVLGMAAEAERLRGELERLS